MPVDSRGFLLLSEYRNPTSSTMKEAPSREPVSMVKAWSSVSADAANSESATAATGDPDRTRYAPIQPRPRVLTGLSTGKVPFRSGASDLAPDFMNWIARMNRNRAAETERAFSAIRRARLQGGVAADGRARS